jgi:hypothetical protein
MDGAAPPVGGLSCGWKRPGGDEGPLFIIMAPSLSRFSWLGSLLVMGASPRLSPCFVCGFNDDDSFSLLPLAKTGGGSLAGWVATSSFFVAVAAAVTAAPLLFSTDDILSMAPLTLLFLSLSFS